MPKRIAMLCWESLHSIPVGGLAPHVSELSTALHRLGHDVHVFTRMGSGQRRYDCIEGVHYHRCPFAGHSNRLAYVDRMCDGMAGRLGETENFCDHPFDIVHAHDWLCVKAMVWAKNERHRRSVLTLHSTEFGRCGNSLCNGESNRIREIEWEGTYVADRVIAVSCALLDEVRWLYSVPRDKTRVVYNGIDVAKFSADIDVKSMLRRYEIGEDDPFILFVGRLAWQKGPDLLVEAMPPLLGYYPKAKFVFVGDGDMRAGLERRVSALGLNHAARFLGYRNGNDLTGLFRSADLVCVPSRNEPFGIVILEAWSAGKPVVATRNGGPAEMVRHGETGLIVFDNKDSVGWGVGTALSDPEAARRMGQNDKCTAQSRYSWDLIARKTEEVYESLR